ncbi:stage III sporulation protein AE [Brotaphodocola catenula]|uniref:Stage III sporulation protein AE n=1 Tax=Brotaphodocola catenula TaxID=2885361 RepID=A0AAE3APW4_9FIRM|nr:stage III sporulation protein AE [Brotaphodocola catenula]MCC2163520.1 stage III sporulation protein AE [Brotaphodocola catenula]
MKIDQNTDLAEQWQEIDQFLKREKLTGNGAFSFSELMKTILAGDSRATGKMLIDALKQGVTGNIGEDWQLAGQLLGIGIVGAVFVTFSNIFSESQISDTGFFMTYLLMFALLVTSFLESVRFTGQVLEQQIEFMKVLMPACLMATAWAGSGLTAVAWYEVVFFLIAIVSWLYKHFFLPLVQMYLLIKLAGNLGKEAMVSKMTELMKSGVHLGVTSLFALVIGFQLIQGMVLPYADAVKSAGMWKMLQVLPGIGNGIETTAKLVFGSGVLIKNTMGAVAIFLLILFSLSPILRLGILLIFYRLISAVLEPVADARLTGCISTAGDAQKMLLEMLLSAVVLFILTIALICTGTNATYLA